MKKKLTILFALVLVFSVLFCACDSGTATAPGDGNGSTDNSEASDSSSSGDTYKIGAYMPMTGASAGNYQMLVNSQDLAVKYINENGGFNGKQVEIIRYDTTTSNEEAAKIAGRLVEVDKVDAALPSPMSNEILSSADALNNAGIPTIVVGTSPTLLTTNNWDYVWRAALNTDYTMPSYLQVMQELDYNKVAIVYSQEEVCVKIKDVFTETCKENNIEITALESVETTDSDYTASVTNIIGSDPDIVFSLVTGNGHGTLRKQLRQQGYNGLVLEREIMADNSMEVAGEEPSNDYIFPSLYVVYKSVDDCDIPYMKDYLEKYEAEYNELPGYDWAYRGYDEIMILWEASKIAGSNDKDAINDAIGQIQMEGLGGNIDFTKSHEGYEDFNIFIYNQSKYSLFSNWLESDGYQKFLDATGRTK